MELVSTIWHVIGATVIFIIGFGVALLLRKPFDVGIGRSFLLYIWHTFFCAAYLFFVINNGGDAEGYYLASLKNYTEFGLGTSGVVFFTSILSVVFGLSILGIFLVYNIIGFIGLLAFDASLRFSTLDKPRSIHRLAGLIVFLPSVSFWSSAIGKDSISFMSTGLALWAALNLNRRFSLMVFAVLIMLFVRPHVAALMALAFTCSILMQADISLGKRLSFGCIGLLVISVLLPFALNYAGMGKDVSLERVSDYIEERQGHNMDGGGGVDIAAMSVPLRLFTYLFRPLPFEAHSVFALAASVDNMVLLFLSIIAVHSAVKRRRHQLAGNRIFMWVYVFSTWSVLAMTTSNLGISVRQKWMFAPMLIYLFISMIGLPIRKLENVQTISHKLLVEKQD
ncbi:MAG: hypothetical protein KUG81_02910 [Gammaproteobacteria bacterium]|nr:hypothetical protein [Gammaproteobacteria bacterium]